MNEQRPPGRPDSGLAPCVVADDEPGIIFLLAELPGEKVEERALPRAPRAVDMDQKGCVRLIRPNPPQPDGDCACERPSLEQVRAGDGVGGVRDPLDPFPGDRRLLTILLTAKLGSEVEAAQTLGGLLGDVDFV